MVYQEGPHQLERVGTGYTCPVCGLSWTREPRTDCPGVRVYNYGEWPENLYTYTQLRRDLRMQPLDRTKAQGCYFLQKSPYRRYLYDINLARHRRVPTDAQREAITKMRAGLVQRYTCARCGHYDKTHGQSKYATVVYSHNGLCEDCDRQVPVIEWAHELFSDPNLIVLDSETTGLNDGGNDEVIELTIVSAAGEVLFSSLIQTQDPDRSDLATHIHGIGREDLNKAPTFPEVWPQIESIMQRYQTIVVYNADFDADLLRTTAARYGYVLPEAIWSCLMYAYAKYHGAWSRYHRSYTWQKLGTACYCLGVETTGYHRATEDALNALGVLKALADQYGQVKIFIPPARVSVPADDDLGELEDHPF